MRIKRFDMTAEVLKFLFGGERHDIQATINALPEDAELVRIHVNPTESTPNKISLFYTSVSFPDLPDGSLLKPERIEVVQYFTGEPL